MRGVISRGRNLIAEFDQNRFGSIDCNFCGEMAALVLTRIPNSNTKLETQISSSKIEFKVQSCPEFQLCRA